MASNSSPNDPVFFLHHANIDRLWSAWMERHGMSYQPVSGGPVGHNIDDSMWPYSQLGLTITNLALVPSYGFMAAAWLTLATEILVMSLSLWIVCTRMGVMPTGRNLGRIAGAAAAAGLLGWGLREAGLPTPAWVAVAGALYAALVIVLGVVRLAELRGLVRRAEA